METARLRNNSGRDLDVRMPGGSLRLVRAGEQLETIEEHAASLAEQVDVWKWVNRPKAAGDAESEPGDAPAKGKKGGGDA